MGGTGPRAKVIARRRRTIVTNSFLLFRGRPRAPWPLSRGTTGPPPPRHRLWPPGTLGTGWGQAGADTPWGQGGRGRGRGKDRGAHWRAPLGMMAERPSGGAPRWAAAARTAQVASLLCVKCWGGGGGEGGKEGGGGRDLRDKQGACVCIGCGGGVVSLCGPGNGFGLQPPRRESIILLIILGLL